MKKNTQDSQPQGVKKKIKYVKERKGGKRCYKLHDSSTPSWGVIILQAPEDLARKPTSLPDCPGMCWGLEKNEH